MPNQTPERLTKPNHIARPLYLEQTNCQQGFPGQNNSLRTYYLKYWQCLASLPTPYRNQTEPVIDRLAGPVSVLPKPQQSDNDSGNDTRRKHWPRWLRSRYRSVAHSGRSVRNVWLVLIQSLFIAGLACFRKSSATKTSSAVPRSKGRIKGGLNSSCLLQKRRQCRASRAIRAA